MVLHDISHRLNLTLDIFNMKISEKCQGFNLLKRFTFPPGADQPCSVADTVVP